MATVSLPEGIPVFPMFLQIIMSIYKTWPALECDIRVS